MSLPSAPTANRGPYEISSVASPLVFSPNPIRWIQIDSAGSGGLVYKDEGGTSRTLTGLLAGRVLFGPFTEITSMTCAKILVGDGPTPDVFPPASLAALYTDAQSTQGTISITPGRFWLATGAPLALFSNGASAVPGSALVDSKAAAIRWNNNATLNGVLASFDVPPDMDITANATLTIHASKTGATSGDACTFDVAAFNQAVGSLDDADADFGGTTSAMTGAATAKTIQAVTLTLALANLAAAPASVTLTIKPTDGTLGTDDLCFLGAVISYRKKLLAS